LQEAGVSDEVVGWVDAEMMVEVCRNIAYKRMPLPLAHVGGRRAYHIQITIVTQRLVKSLSPSLESAELQGPAP
jgi:hypothetical protein